MDMRLFFMLLVLASGLWSLLRRSRFARPERAASGADGGGPTVLEDAPGAFPLVLTEGPDPVVLPEHSRFEHLGVVGASGTGKNYRLLLPAIHQDLRRKACVILFDTKGSMRPAVEAYARTFRRLKELRCLDLGHPESSDTYNPFVGEDPTLVAERVHAALFSTDATPTGYYRDLALSLLYPFFALCRRLDVLATPGQLRRVAQDQQALAAFAALAPRSGESRELRRLFLRQSPMEYAKNFQGLVNTLTPLSGGAFAPILDTVSPGVVVSEVLEQGGILYVGLAADQYPTAYKRVSTLLLMDLQACLTKRYASKPKPCFVYLDEFADLLYPQAGALVAKARDARVGLTLAHQSLGDLGPKGSSLAEAVFGNLTNKVLLRQGSPDSALTLARLSGTKGPAEEVQSTIHARGIRGARRGQRLATAKGGEYLFEPNELLNLAVGEAFIVTQHSAGRVLSRGRLLSAPPWKTRQAAPYVLRPGRARAPLVLVEGEDLDTPRLDPGTELGRAALERMGRKGKGGRPPS